MEHTTPNKDEIKLLIDNALLKNNEQLIDKFTKALEEKMNPALSEVITLAEKVGTLKGELDTMKLKLSNIWGKFIGIGAALASLTALVTYLLTKG